MLCYLFGFNSTGCEYVNAFLIGAECRSVIFRRGARDGIAHGDNMVSCNLVRGLEGDSKKAGKKQVAAIESYV